MRRRDDRPSQKNVWNLAALSAAICLCSVLGAKTLSSALDRGDLASLAPVRVAEKMRGPGVAHLGAAQKHGVDREATGSIPQKHPASPAPVNPCGK